MKKIRAFLVALLLSVGAFVGLGHATAFAGMTGCFAGQSTSTFAVAGCSSLGGSVATIRVWVYCSNAPTTPKFGPWVAQTSNIILSGVQCTGGSHITHVAYEVIRLQYW